LQKPAAHIALVLFARSAPEEAVHKNLLPRLAATQQQPVFEAFNAASLALLAATGLPYYLVSSAEQQGASFGERLYRALAQTFAKGFEQVIVIGNDCPQLRVADLHRAASQLMRHEAVLGPCPNGGIYLLGLTKKAFEQADRFGAVAWQTPAVYRQLMALLQQGGGTVASLPAYTDINTPEDLRRARQRKWLRRSLRSMLVRLLDLVVPKGSQPQLLFLPTQYLPAARFRGPPVFSF
jgi:uncharacterized protein